MGFEIHVTTDNTDEIINLVRERCAAALEAVGMQVETYAKQLCPVDTGALRNSITHAQVDDETEIIGSNMQYSAYVELGTSKQRAQPYLKPAVVDHKEEYKRIFQSILKGN